jgi:hypothetical protein
MSNPNTTIQTIKEAALTVKGQDQVKISIRQAEGTIAAYSFMLIFAIVLLGILSANVVYFGRVVRFYDEATATQIATLQEENFPITRGSAQSIKIANGVLLSIPLAMLIISIIMIALTAKSKQQNQKGLNLALEEVQKEKELLV